MIANWSNRSGDSPLPEWVAESLREHYEPQPGTDDHKALELAIGEVLFNVNNYPEPAQSRLLGSDFSKLKNKLIAAVLAAGFRKVE